MAKLESDFYPDLSMNERIELSVIYTNVNEFRCRYRYFVGALEDYITTGEMTEIDNPFFRKLYSVAEMNRDEAIKTLKRNTYRYFDSWQYLKMLVKLVEAGLTLKESTERLGHWNPYNIQVIPMVRGKLIVTDGIRVWTDRDIKSILSDENPKDITDPKYNFERRVIKIASIMVDEGITGLVPFFAKNIYKGKLL